jgi:hypothetical protein
MGRDAPRSVAGGGFFPQVVARWTAERETEDNREDNTCTSRRTISSALDSLNRQFEPGSICQADWIRADPAEDAVLLCNQAPTISVLSTRTADTFRFPCSLEPRLVQQATERMQRRLTVTTRSGARIPVYQLGPGKSSRSPRLGSGGSTTR